MPSQEKVMLDIMRQQKIKEELFLYLLNKQAVSYTHLDVYKRQGQRVRMR